MSTLTNQLVIAERADVARGIRALLATPLLTERSSPEVFELIRRRRDPIKKWFEHYCGWTLHVESRVGYARLVKVRLATDPTRPARRSGSGRPAFDRRRYVLLCIVAAELLAVPVTTIGLLADRVQDAMASDPDLVAFDSSSRRERVAFADAVRLLESCRAVEVIDGATESYVDSADAKVLYRVDATLVMRLLASPVGASQLEVPTDELRASPTRALARLVVEQRYGAAADPGTSESMSPVQRNLWLRHSVFRKLVDDPVVYFDDLSPEERGYLGSITGRQLMRNAADEAGFTLEERAEGVMLVDPDGLATDERLPGEGAVKTASLLLLDALARAGGVLAVEQLHVAMTGVLEANRSWAKAYQGDVGVRDLVAEALLILESFGLVAAGHVSVRLLPAAARYRVGAPRTSAAGDAR